MRSLALRVTVLGCVIAQSAFGQIPRYHLTDLGVLPGLSTSDPTGINNRGQVSGYSDWIASYWSQATGLVRISPMSGDEGSSALAINNLGQLAGTSWSGNWVHREAFRWDSFNGMLRLGYMTGYNHSEAQAINEYGEICGQCWQGANSLDEGPGEPFIWVPGEGFHDIGQAFNGKGATAIAINKYRMVCGRFGGFQQGTNSQGWVYDWVTDTTQEVGLPSGVFHCYPTCIGDDGTVGGYVQVRNDSTAYFRAFLWNNTWNPKVFLADDGVATSADSGFLGRNKLGQYVGWVYLPSKLAVVATLWTSQNHYLDLNDLCDNSAQGWKLSFASSINDHGWIAAVGTYNSGQHHAVLLRPILPTVTPIPH